MNKISAVVIAKNEEQMLGDCLESLSFCDEIIVIDNASIDKTKDIAQKQGAKVFSIDTNDFSELRNLGLQKASHEYLLYLDADERIDSELKNSIIKAASEDNFSFYYLKRQNYYLGKNPWPRIEKMERLFRKKDLQGWKGQLHETPDVKGEGKILDGFILHFTHRDLESMINKTLRWSTTEAILRYNQNHPKMTWWRFPRVMIMAFFDSYIKQQGYKARTAGLVESMFQAFSIFITYAKLWELQQKEISKKNV